MAERFSPLEWGPISLVRRNHGLEHATINLLSKKHPGQAYAGHSDTGGFWLVGQIQTDELVTMVQTALARMNAGEHRLAIHPHCGTNAATTGVIAGALAWLAMVNTGNNWKKKFDRLPLVMLLTTLAVIASEPLGPKVQEKITTSGLPGGLRVTRIICYERSETDHSIIHRVETEDTAVKEPALA
jgi:hypothetical protein